MVNSGSAKEHIADVGKGSVMCSRVLKVPDTYLMSRSLRVQVALCPAVMSSALPSYLRQYDGLKT